MSASRAPAPPGRDREGGAGGEGSDGAPTTGETCRVDLRIQGMDCPDCARRIQEHLVGVQGVREAVGNPVSRRLRVAFDAGVLDVDRLREEVGRLGYVAREEGDEAPEETTWLRPDAWRAYVAAGLFVLALAARFLGLGAPALTVLGRQLGAPELLFLVSAGVGGWNFFPAGLRAARTLALDMNFLMTVAILGAVVLGEYLEASAIAFLFSVAELLETYAVDRARASIEALMDLSPERATVVREGEEVVVAASDVRPGDRMLVRPGERIAADGRVVEGRSAVNQAPITGESMPVDKSPDDRVFAGTIGQEGYLVVEVEKAAEDTTLAHIIHLVEEAESHKAPSERFVDRFARWYTPAVTLGAVLLAAGPPLVADADPATWVLRGLTLLVIACPCALVISTPVAVVSGITAAARNGVLIKGGNHLERLGEVRVVALDKTGTLTYGHPEVTDVEAADDLDPDELLRGAAALESRSEHPLGRAIVRGARHRDLRPEDGEVADFEALPGRGVKGRVGGDRWVVGREELFGRIPERLASRAEELRSEGKTVVLVGRGREENGADAAGLVAVGDRAREKARRTVDRLREMGIERIVMLTGDHEGTARALGEQLGLDEVHAELLPDQKVDLVRRLGERWGAVAMVGDGVNDAPALAVAGVGIVMGAAGSDAALETADVALMGDELAKLPYVFRLSRTGRSVIRQNIGASVLLKAGLAVGVPLGLVSLILAVVVGDMGASLGVTGNALRLARLRP